jgi:hypothetical protein
MSSLVCIDSGSSEVRCVDLMQMSLISNRNGDVTFVSEIDHSIDIV